MASPFIGEIRMMGCNFAPRNNAFCNGQIMSIAQNTALFSLLGTTYGGNGQTTFALPDLQGRAPMHWGQGPGLPLTTLGQSGGAETVTLISQQLPSHNHSAACVTSTGNQYGPSGNTWAPDAAGLNFYGAAASLTPMAASAIANTGSGQAHNNLQPSRVINFIIALFGIFPSRN